MYKKHLKQWNARRYNEESEMAAIVRKGTERARMGKASVFEVRGQVVNTQKMRRYRNRNGRSIDNIDTRGAVPSTPDSLKCFTPLQSPLRTPEALAVPEYMLVKLQDYIKGSFDAGKWRDIQPDQNLDRFRKHCQFALQLFDTNRVLEGGQAFNSAFANIETVIRSEHISTIPILFNITGLALRKSRSLIVLALLRQVSAMAENFLGGSHPFKDVCSWLASLAQTNETLYKELSIIALQKMADCFQNVLGPTHKETLGCLAIITEIKADEGVDGKIRKVLSDCEPFLGEHDFRTLESRYTSAHNLYSQGKFGLAKEAFQDFLSCVPPETRSCLKGECLLHLAWCQYKLGDKQEAVETMRETVAWTLSGESSEQGWACGMMVSLEYWLAGCREFESAYQVWVTRLDLQASMKVELLEEPDWLIDWLGDMREKGTGLANRM